MKAKKIFILITFLLMAGLSGCVMLDSNINGLDGGSNRYTVYGSGQTVTVVEDFKNFNGIEIDNGFSVEITRSDNYSITIEVDDNLKQYVNSYMSGNRIVIGMDNDNNYKDATLKAVVEMPDIETINASGGTIINLSGFEFTHGLSVNLSGGSIIKGNINVGSLNMNLSGGGIAQLTGNTNEMNISGSGGSVLNLFNFMVHDCSIDFSGGSIANINVSGTLNLNLSGGSILKYKGNPTIGTVHISGGSIWQNVN